MDDFFIILLKLLEKLNIKWLTTICYLLFSVLSLILFLLILSYPIIYLFCKWKMNYIKNEFLQCKAQYKWEVEYYTELRSKYQLYKSVILALNPMNMSPSVYFTKPLLKENIKDDNFALFLRGFEKDKYMYDIRLRAKMIWDSFSEYHFVTLINKYMRVYAVGMTNEIEPAVGADRIYLPNESWQSDVIELMDKANMLIILVNDKPNCLWEIEQSLKYKDKTIYIIDDVSKYEALLHDFKIKNINGIPSLPISFSCYFWSNSNSLVINPLHNTYEDYKKNIDYIFKNFIRYNHHYLSKSHIIPTIWKKVENIMNISRK